jgi:hypothetical protein
MNPPHKLTTRQAMEWLAEQVRERCAKVAFSAHKLNHLESCRCKRCKEAEKIEKAIRGQS